MLGQAIEAAAPLIKARLAAMQDARWRSGDRDRKESGRGSQAFGGEAAARTDGGRAGRDVTIA